MIYKETISEQTHFLCALAATQPLPLPTAFLFKRAAMRSTSVTAEHWLTGLSIASQDNVHFFGNSVCHNVRVTVISFFYFYKTTVLYSTKRGGGITFRMMWLVSNETGRTVYRLEKAILTPGWPIARKTILKD